MYSKVIQLYIYMYLLFVNFFSHLGYHRTLRVFPVLYNRSFLVIYFKYRSMHLSIPEYHKLKKQGI